MYTTFQRHLLSPAYSEAIEVKENFSITSAKLSFIYKHLPLNNFYCYITEESREEIRVDEHSDTYSKYPNTSEGSHTHDCAYVTGTEISF